MHDSLDLILGRVEQNFEEMKKEAHRELASVNHSFRSPTNPYLICRGEGLLADYVQLTRHREVTKVTSEDYKTKVAQRLTKLQGELQQDSLDAALAHDSARGNSGVSSDSAVGQFKFSGEEIPSHVSPAALVRRKGPCG